MDGVVGWRNALQWGFDGHTSHVEPRRAVRGLTAAQAALVPPGGLHSAHRLLYHIVYWQELVMAPVLGEGVRWPEGPEDWESEMPPWAELVRRFEDNLDKAAQLAEAEELTRVLPEWDESITVGGALTALITHNSYHLGQLIDARRATGCWEGEKTG